MVASVTKTSLFITLSLLGTGVSAQMDTITMTDVTPATAQMSNVIQKNQCTVLTWKKMQPSTSVKARQFNGMFISKGKFKNNYFIFSPIAYDPSNDVLTMAVISAQMIKVPTYTTMSKTFVNNQVAKLTHDIPIQAQRASRILDNELEIVVQDQDPMRVQVASTNDFVGCTNQKGCEAQELIIK